jgi:dipeptidyl aminopeptidase/acylaminoacyl peptidase
MMSKKQTADYGSWKSPISSDLIVAATVGFGGVSFDGNDIYWLEGRPQEGGRNVLVCYHSDESMTDITPQPFNVRSRVHEYGGGAFLISEGTVYFTNFVDQRIYVQKPNQPPQPLTPEGKLRYADFCLDSQRNRLICVCEDHTPLTPLSKEGTDNEPPLSKEGTDNDTPLSKEGNDNQSSLSPLSKGGPRGVVTEPINKIVSIDLKTGTVTTLVEGNDFYSSPRLSTDGSKLAWLTWNHPNMPWDNTELWLATLNQDGTIEEKQCIAGGEGESICQPEFSPDGKLYFSSDRTQWWNLYRYNPNGRIESLFPLDAEFGYPHWVFGESVYGFLSERELVCTYTQNGSWYFALLDTERKNLTNFDIPYTTISHLQVNPQTRQVLFIGGSPTQPTGIVRLDLDQSSQEILKQSSNLNIDPGYLSIPSAIAFPTTNGQTAYGWYYPTQNKDYTAPEGNLPPLLVKSHGGPTAATSASFNLRIQYWTSRGFAFLDVNYGGSTGYGRDYRERLNGNWGIVDVDDCVNGAKYLVEQNKVDPNKLAISGGSAGGYTTLAALTFRDTFKAGASHYGISDLEALARDTHKFEARYLDGLIGKYPEEKEIYIQRSPINFTEQLSCPVAFFQGLEDKVVPPNQAKMMVEALTKKGIQVLYVPFEGEQHGFRKAENIKRALDEEFNFYAQVFKFI